VVCNLTTLCESNEHEAWCCSLTLSLVSVRGERLEREERVNGWKISGSGDRRVALDINLVNTPPLPNAGKIIIKIYYIQINNITIE